MARPYTLWIKLDCTNAAQLLSATRPGHLKFRLLACENGGKCHVGSRSNVLQFASLSCKGLYKVPHSLLTESYLALVAIESSHTMLKLLLLWLWVRGSVNADFF